MHGRTSFFGQTYIISGLQTAKLKSDESGVCAGTIQKGIEAFFLGDLPKYDARIIELHQIWKRKHSSTYQASLITTDNNAFFNGLQLYQKPSKFREFFGRHLSQYRVEEISRIACSIGILECGGLFEVDHFLNFFTLSEINYFLLLIKKYSPYEKIAMSFSCDNHRIGVCYNGFANSFILIDANQLPSQVIALYEFAKIIFDAFKVATSNHAAISIRLYSTGKHKKFVQAIAAKLRDNKEFQKLIAITPEKILLKTNDQSNLLHLAAKYNHAESLQLLLQTNSLDPNSTNDSQRTPLTIAAAQGHAECATLLLNHPNIIIESKDKPNKTALAYAAKNDDAKMADTLLQYGANPYLEPPDNQSPLVVAVVNQSFHVLKTFAKHHVNFTQADGSGKSPLEYALQNQNSEMIQFIEQQSTSPGYKDSRKRTFFGSDISQHQKKKYQAEPALKFRKT